MEFFGAFDNVDLALLKQGWHLAYHNVRNMYGSPKSIEYLRSFQEAVVNTFNLYPKAVLLGFSRGGLYAVNYAVAYPDNVSALYLDAPVLDIRSWPGGKGTGLGDTACWIECLKQYGLTEKSAVNFKQNPLDKAEMLASTGIPIIAVVGLSDQCVPCSENIFPFKERFQAAGGYIHIIEKPGCDHHPHSLADPTEIVDFIINAVKKPIYKYTLEQQEWSNFWWESARDREKPRVLLIGDSITNGYRHTINKALNGEILANIWATSKALYHPDYIKELEFMWQQNKYTYDLVHFNNGLHGWHLNDEDYEKLYERVVLYISQKHPDSKIALALSTPVCIPGSGMKIDPIKNGIIQRRNNIVRKISDKYRFPVNDLYSLMWERNEYRCDDGFHFNQSGSVYLGNAVAEFIRSHFY